MKRLNNTKAFTLIELIVVVAMLGILVLLAAPRFMGHTNEALETSLRHDAKLIQNASNLYHLDNDEWPHLTDDSGELVEIGPNGMFDILYKVEDFDDDNTNIVFYEIDFDKLDPYISINNDHGYFVASVGNPDFGITALNPKNEVTHARLNNEDNPVDIEQAY